MYYVHFGSNLPKPTNSKNTNNNHADKSSRETIIEDAISLKTIAVWSLTRTLSCIPGNVITYFCIFPRVWMRRPLYLVALEKLKINLRDPAKRSNPRIASMANIRRFNFNITATRTCYIYQDGI